MNRKELIEIAKVCRSKNCVGIGKCPLYEYTFCKSMLIGMLTEELEKSTLTITVKRKVQKNENKNK